MHILYITNHFSLPDQPGAPRPWQVARHLQKQGYFVTVLTNRRHYLDESIHINNQTICKNDEHERIDIIGVETIPGRRKSLSHRVVNYFIFSLKILLRGLNLSKIDAVIAGTPPIFTPIAGRLIGWRHHAFTILEIRDLHPEKAVAVQAIRSNYLICLWRFYEFIMRNVYHHLVAVEPSTHRRLLEKGFSFNKLTLIPNGIDEEHMRPRPLPDFLKVQFLRYKNWTIVTYGGGLGIGNFLHPVFEAADLCRHEQVVFFIFGEGEMKNEYMAYVNNKKLQNVCFFPLQTRQIINEVFRRSTVLIYSVRKDIFFDGLMTNKIFEYLASGRPIVFSGKGDMAKIIRDARAGICVDPEDPYKIDQAVRFLIKNPASGDLMGQNGKLYVVKHHLRNKIFNKWRKVLSGINPEGDHTVKINETRFP